ncbi:hypothetical protein SCLCIDRAFT_593290 [Scleroderma citrinum Foug A]|uniref:Uncharacterized protein n=1 Tax=Scleroderma citrinum Foug A TaxID=1036808 RepID=A0A0C2ZTC7_9AGAM|nr:hypothetical protein SCLCIDRAFT_593290 [Scleroderma citrinum Foug A]
MIHDHSRKAQDSYEPHVDGVSMKSSKAPQGTKLGDYGHFSDCEDFCCEGNIFVASFQGGHHPKAARGISKRRVPERERLCFGPLERARFYRIIQTTLPVTSN